jgi:hypothetical protein
MNDHVLKRVWPGGVTGKLSDFAGVLLVALLVGWITRNRAFAVASTAVGFAAIKLSLVAAAVAAPVLGGITSQDPTDLLALVILWPAFRLLGSPGDSTHQSFGILAPISAVVAVLALTATSCGAPLVVDGFAVEGDAIYARIHEDVRPGQELITPDRWAVSLDGGRSWAASSPPVSPARQNRQACQGDLCARLVKKGVEIKRGSGNWERSFGFTDEEIRRMDLGADCAGPAVDLRAAQVLALEDGLHVVVAAGSQGALHRTPTGTWDRVPVLDREPLPLWGPRWLRLFAFEAPLALVLVALVLAVVAGLRVSPSRGLTMLGFTLSSAFILLLMAFSASFGGGHYAIIGPVIAALSLGVFAASLVLSVRREKIPPRPDEP